MGSAGLVFRKFAEKTELEDYFGAVVFEMCGLLHFPSFREHLRAPLCVEQLYTSFQRDGHEIKVTKPFQLQCCSFHDAGKAHTRLHLSLITA